MFKSFILAVVQARVYLHPALQNPEKIELYAYPSYPISQDWEKEYTKKLQELCQILKSL